MTKSSLLVGIHITITIWGGQIRLYMANFNLLTFWPLCRHSSSCAPTWCRKLKQNKHYLCDVFIRCLRLLLCVCPVPYNPCLLFAATLENFKIYTRIRDRKVKGYLFLSVCPKLELEGLTCAGRASKFRLRG